MSQDHVWTISPVERIRFLKSFGPLTALPLDEISLMAQHTEECIFRAGDMILGPGQVERPIAIVSGRVRVSADWILADHLGPGEQVGFLASLTDRWADLEVVAETDVTALGLSPEVLTDVFEDRFPILVEVIRGMAGQSLIERQGIADGTYLAIPGRIVALPEGPLYLVDVLVMLRQAGAFTGAGVNALVRMAGAVEQLRLPPGSLLWSFGDPSGHLITPLTGEIECSLPDGRKFRAGPGYPLGALESTARQNRWYDAVTLTDIVAFRSRTADFFDMLEDHPDVALQFLAQTAANLVRLRSEAKKALQKEKEPEPARVTV